MMFHGRLPESLGQIVLHLVLVDRRLVTWLYYNNSDMK